MILSIRRRLFRGVKVGFVVNPIAGMGGKVGLKGTDGDLAVKEALDRGAEQVSPRRATEALADFRGKGGIDFVCAGADMGAHELEAQGIRHVVVYPLDPGKRTTRKDTIEAATKILAAGAEIILFAGGDGTARDLLEAVDGKVPILGIPTGVKMESAVFANSPSDIPHLLESFAKTHATREAEVLDVDEDGFRRGVVSVRIFGYARVPDDPAHLQSSKESYHSGTADDEAKEIGQFMADTMEGGTAYILGPGSTTSRVAECLGQTKTLLGVDVFLDRKPVVKDASESDLLSFLAEHPRAVIVVSPIGAQGFFFGRGNQQISGEVIRRVGVENIVILATPSKLAGTPVLRVDTGDESLDRSLKGRRRVVTGYRRRRLVPVL